MHELIPLIKDLAIMLGIASVVVVLCQKIRQPVILGYIIAGLIIGPYTPPYSLVTDFTQIKALAELGIIFLMFALGLDFSFHKLKRIGFAAAVTGLIKVSAVMAMGFYVGRLMKWTVYDAIFFGSALAISSTVIIIKALDELNLKGKRFTDLVFGILIIEDLLAILMLTTLSTVGATKNFFSVDMIFATLKLILVIGSWFVAGYFVVPILFRKISKYISQETLTIVSIALCLLLAVTAAYLHYSAALGAFIMGSVLSETPMSYRIKQLTEPLRDVFAAVFFISVGMMIDMHVFFDHWLIILTMSMLVAVGRILATSVGAFLSGQSISTCVRAGFSMVPIGEFSFIIVSLGLVLNLTNNLIYQIIVGVAAVTTLVTPYLIKLSGYITDKLETKMSDRTKYFLESYSAWVYRALASYTKQIEYRKFVVRLVLNGAIIAVLFTLVHDFGFPQIARLIKEVNVAQTVSWIVALLLSSPFVWGMLFGFELIDQKRQIPALFLGVSITVLEIIILSITYFSSWYILLMIAVVASVLFGLLYRQLESSYHWFEKHLVRVLKRKQQDQSSYEELAPWDTHLVEVNITNESPGSVIGKTLSDNRLRQKYGVNVVAIRRGNKVILTPRGEEQILPHDKLLVVGNDEQIESFRKNAEDDAPEEKKEDVLKDFMLKAILLDEDSPYVGKTIRGSNIREDTSGLVVGLERNGFRMLNPDPSAELKAHDMVLVVGRGSSFSQKKDKEV